MWKVIEQATSGATPGSRRSVERPPSSRRRGAEVITAAHAEPNGPSLKPSLGDRLPDLRLARRDDRFQLAGFALGERPCALGARGEALPQPLGAFTDSGEEPAEVRPTAGTLARARNARSRHVGRRARSVTDGR